MGFAVIPVEGFEVEVELAEVFWSECADFEFDGDEAIQAAMKKEQIEGKILSADLEWMLGTDEAEIAAQLGDEAAQIPQQAAVEVGFVVFGRKTEKFKRVDVFEKICCLRVQFSQHG